ncbi:hypothetical protein GCM10010911_56430 [Paenibacillus nasutitermitis]|uniref:Uncharacterized protein n=1 Tax=Paenibacillus nasutitermitis TaxID=1652958 RepID=A0A917E1L9_9BACL|nr:hypothetical protein GCM10010911_56430 [Paenibacillus nasutitermitis]
MAPDPAAFSARAKGKRTDVLSAAIEGDKVILLLRQEVKGTKNITVSYTPGSLPMQDAAGFKVEPFTNVPVTDLLP